MMIDGDDDDDDDDDGDDEEDEEEEGDDDEEEDNWMERLGGYPGWCQRHETAWTICWDMRQTGQACKSRDESQQTTEGGRRRR